MRRIFAGIAQLVEQLICNQQVVGSNPTAGSIFCKHETNPDFPIRNRLKEIAFSPLSRNDIFTI
jgi:hypothetical protein